MKRDIYYKEECYDIQGAIFDVYREMGGGYLEAVYQECLEKEFNLRDIPFESQKELKLTYKGASLAQRFKPDFICYGSIILEIKAVKETCSAHKAQLGNYLNSTGMKLGLLVNFGAFPKATVERFVL
jgi:GxxExxY protein